MKLNEFLLFEFKDFSKGDFDFWADELGNLLIDIDDKDDALNYIKKKSHKLNGKYKHKIDGRDIKDLTIDEIVRKMGWSHITLKGTNDSFIIKNTSENKNKVDKLLKPNVYTYAIIYNPSKHNPGSKDKDQNIEEIMRKLKTIFPSIIRGRSIDRDQCVKEIGEKIWASLKTK